MFSNEYLLKVDLKLKYSTTTPVFVQYDSAALLFMIFDNGKAVDLTGYTSVEVSHKRPDGLTIVGIGSVVKDAKGNDLVRYEYQGNEMNGLGFIETSVSVISNTNKISIQPFKVKIVTDLRDGVVDPSNPEHGKLQELIVKVETATTNAETATTNAITATNDANTLVANTEYTEDYNPLTNYKKNNIVTFNGSSYVAKQDTVDNSPPLLPETTNDFWGLAGRKGADGTGTVFVHRNIFIATEGQTLFTLSSPYDVLQNRIEVEVGGVPQFSPDNFTETSSTTFTLSEGITAGTKVIATYFSEAVALREDLDTVINSHTTSINDHETRIDTIETTPITQVKMGLDVVASATGKAVRWDEFSLKHNNNGTFKGIDQADMNLATSATVTKKPVRWDEFSLKHNNDGTFKTNVITNADIGLIAAAAATGDAIRWDEFSSKHNNDGSFKAGVITNNEIHLATAPTSTGDAIRWDEFSIKHNNDGTFKTGAVGTADIADISINNAKVSNTAAIVASKLAIQKLYKKSPAPVVSATADTFGTAIDLIPATGYISLVPQLFDVVFGGTFGTETVTVEITVTFSDATTATVTKTATAIGNGTLTSSELMALIKDDVYINKISVKSKSSIASSTATTSLNHFGFYL